MPRCAACWESPPAGTTRGAATALSAVAERHDLTSRSSASTPPQNGTLRSAEDPCRPGRGRRPGGSQTCGSPDARPACEASAAARRTAPPTRSGAPSGTRPGGAGLRPPGRTSSGSPTSPTYRPGRVALPGRGLDAWSRRVVGWAMKSLARHPARPGRSGNGRPATPRRTGHPPLRSGLPVHLPGFRTTLPGGRGPAFHGLGRRLL